VIAAGQGEVRMFCMDTPTAEYFLFKHDLDHEFRQSPALYTAPFDWAVLRGQSTLRDFVDAGFARIRPTEWPKSNRAGAAIRCARRCPDPTSS